MLRVTLLGNLGADPEVRFSQKGTQFVQFSVAVSLVRFGPDRERQENTEWFRVRVSGRQVEYAQRLTKGSRVFVLGQLDIGHYQSKTGEARVSYDVWADEIQIASSNRPYSAEMDGPEAESQAGEPALTGVSSLGGGGNAATNGRAPAQNGRARAARGDGGGASGGSAGDLEDLPF
ncbi:MAG: single-stranded DNA-binding protein [Chloroflexi bacterium]|nr:single-stranded DNA-binding protein [Chloroflexota bacterium]